MKKCRHEWLKIEGSRVESRKNDRILGWMWFIFNVGVTISCFELLPFDWTGNVCIGLIIGIFNTLFSCFVIVSSGFFDWFIGKYDYVCVHCHEIDATATNLLNAKNNRMNLRAKARDAYHRKIGDAL